MKLQVGVKAFLQNPKGEYLLVKRNVEKYSHATHNPWDIVGGRIEDTGTLHENLAREIAEETGLTMTSEPRLVYAQDIFVGDEKHVVRLTYTATTESTPVLDTAENTEYRWVSLEKLTAFPGLDDFAKEVIEQVLTS